MTIEYVQQIVRIFRLHPWHSVSLFLILGLSGIFFPFLSICTTLSLLLSMILIPGFVLIYHADRSLITRNPVTALAGSVLISITTLIIYVLICEIADIPMTVTPGLSSKAGIFFQTGILLYALAPVAVTIRRNSGAADRNQFSLRAWCRSNDITVPFISLISIVALVSLCAGIFLTGDTTEPTTELFFSQQAGSGENGVSPSGPDTTVTIVNHEKRSVEYTLTIEISGKEQTTIPVRLEDSQSYSTSIRMENERGSVTGRPLIRVRLFDDRSQKTIYREIWRQG